MLFRRNREDRMSAHDLSDYYASYRQVGAVLRSLKAEPILGEEPGADDVLADRPEQILKDDYGNLMERLVAEMDAELPPEPLALFHTALKALDQVQARRFALGNLLEDLKRNEKLDVHATLTRYDRLGLLDLGLGSTGDDEPPTSQNASPQPGTPSKGPRRGYPPVRGGAQDNPVRMVSRFVKRLIGKLDQVALTLMQAVVVAINEIPMLRDAEASIGVFPVPSLSIELKPGMAVGEFFETLRRRLS